MNNSLQTYPSIFNDVIGPVMRGPSSSHCAAAVRIGKMVRDLMDGEIKDVLIEFDPDGSLATTHVSQGSEMGLFGGFLGWDATDGRLADSPKAIQEAGINVKTVITPLDTDHPNTYKMTVTNSRETHTITALSTGGGIIEVTEIDGTEVSMAGDYFETIIYTRKNGKIIIDELLNKLSADEILFHKGKGLEIVEIKSRYFLNSLV